MSAHTPGPWKIDRYHPSRSPFGISRDTGDAMQNKSVINSGGFARKATDEAEANARLIAAAPDLLEALTLLHNNLAEYQVLNKLGGYDNHDMKMARAAIAKATGE